MPAAGINFIQLEGNYVVSFRDMNECLPAFTAVKLDRRRGSHGSAAAELGGVGGTPFGTPFGTPHGTPHGSLVSLGDDPGISMGIGGSAVCLMPPSSAPTARRRSSAATAPYKLVVTGIPRGVGEDVIRGRLDATIPGIERVYRDPDLARELSHPPVFVETRLALAQEAFMLRPDWVAVVQRIIREAGAAPAAADEGLGSSVESTVAAKSTSSPLGDPAERVRRRSLVDTLVACPHGRYNGPATCPICRHARRLTMVADDIVGHVFAPTPTMTPSPLATATTTATAGTTVPQQAAAKAAKAVKPGGKSSCASCVACLRRFVPGWRKKSKSSSDDEDDGNVDVVVVVDAPPREERNNDCLLDPKLLSRIKSQRRLSAYDDVPGHPEVPVITLSSDKSDH